MNTKSVTTRATAAKATVTAAATAPKRQVLPPHVFPADAETYLAACSAEERRLVDLAIQMLGSSYFMEKSHGYLAWKAKQGNPKGQ